PDWVRHDGEEFLMVLAGSILLYSEFYEPLPLGEGDSIYFDSDMGHALVSTSEEDAIVLSVCTRNDSDPS
ncbi:cupin domain-containing protein, partial [Cobetia sp.]